jgi:predicted O-methyltransferase YrrM
MIDSINDGRSITVRDHQLFDFPLAVRAVHASQRLDEFAALLERIERLRPRRVLEIGTYLGGTLWFLARASDPQAVVVSVDVDAPVFARVQRARLARRRQRIVSLEGDSHDPATLERVRKELGDQPLDVLFIDADHSYEAVKRDYEIYSPLVRSGGLIALHDINPRRSGGIFGEVPRFWAELRAEHPGATEEFLSRGHEDGYGIGVVYPGSRSL